MNKRSFLKKSAILTAGSTLATFIPVGLKAEGIYDGMDKREGEDFKLPELPYAYDDLEPYIDAMTMEIHYSRHHAGYTSKFNAAIHEYGLEGKKIEEIFSGVSDQPLAIRNNGGGYYNHKLFWKSMSPQGGGQPRGDLLKAIERNFGSFENFREKLSTAAATQFGSGWAWLVLTAEGKLAVTSTSNQDNPLMDVANTRGIPLLAIDVWEHAYYLKYQNRRPDYIAAFWNVVSWDFVSEQFSRNLL